MSAQELAAAINAAVEKATAAGEHLQTAMQSAEDASEALAQATQGSTDQELGQAMGLLAQAVQDVADVGQLVAKVSSELSAYMKSVTGDQGEDESGGRLSGQSAPSGGKKPEPDDPVEKARRELPERGTGRGVKTTGRWFAPGKTTSAVTSGRDAWTDRVNEVVREAGCPYVPLTASADVELKIAAEMRDTGITDATVVLNNAPCTGLTSCDSLLGVVLPAGSTLTVHGPGGFKKVYKGGKRW
ncbi:DddA-like double-stranded DNA deaminase toxin [Amycolatopsis samaneae]|uniref:DddA-like double-stranded DNA deaminase toxin n=1 Tax=Amycolatopsis samaneae TaxID=664691 RepID=A0ABW5GIL7_9PSEU